MSSSLQRSSYASWSVDSAEALTTPEDISNPNQQSAGPGSIPFLPLSASETTGGLTNTTLSHQPPQPPFTRQTQHRAFRHSLSRHIFSQKHRSPHDDDDNGDDGEDDEDDEDEEGRMGSVRPPEVDWRSQEDQSLLHLEDEFFHLPRSSPVISRRRRSVSWHGRDTDDEPSLSSSHSPSSASGAPSLGHGGSQTALAMEDPAVAPGATSSPRYRSSTDQEHKKPRCISVSSNLNRLLSVGLYLPFRGLQGLAEEFRGRGLSSSDFPPRPVTQHPNNGDKRSSDIPECFADIFRTSCELEKENAHFIVVDMVLEVLESVKWTLSLSQWTSTDTHTHQNTHRHTGSAADMHTHTDGQISKVETHTCKHTHYTSAGEDKLTRGHEDGPEDNSSMHAEKDMQKSHANTRFPAADIHTRRPTHEEEEEKPGNEATQQAKTHSVLSTDSGFEDCRVDKILTPRGSLRKSLRCPMLHSSVEWLAQQLVLGFRRTWFPSHEPRRGRQSLRTSLQELPGTGADVVSAGSLTEEIRLRTRMRGSLSWAPPRFQIIFTVQPTHRRSDVVALQHFLCAGCGTEVEARYIKKLRYCEYLGKYFCDCCHAGSEAVIPGRVLADWDFGRYSVSDFSKQLLDSVWHQPLFDLTSVGKTLHGRVRELDRFRELQEQLLGIKKLLAACRLSDGVMNEFEQLPGHLTQQPNLFSMDDLLRVKRGQLVPLARAVLLSATDHVDNCELCLARGFICEFCRERDVIFPFQSHSCKRCPVCKACFHKNCFMEKNCPKCARIQSRRKLLDGSSLNP